MIFLMIASICFFSFMVHRFLSSLFPSWKWAEMLTFSASVCFWDFFDFSYLGVSSFFIVLASVAPLLPPFEFVEENRFFVDPQDFALHENDEVLEERFERDGFQKVA